MIGIYKIVNKVNNKAYVGQSVNIESRWKEHISNANGSSRNNAIYQAMRKYGIQNFSFEIVEECSELELNDREKYWISFYDSYNNGYNMTLGGDGGNIYDYQDIAEKYSIYKTTEETAKQIGCHYHTVSNALKALNITPNANSLGVAKRIKQINPYTLEVINVYDSVNEAVKSIGASNHGAISKVLTGKMNAAYGYIWRYEDDTSPLEKINIKNMHHKQILQQLHPETEEVINEYNSMKDALIALNKSPKTSSIYKVCKGERKTAFGYKWRYIEK